MRILPPSLSGEDGGSSTSRSGAEYFVKAVSMSASSDFLLSICSARGCTVGWIWGNPTSNEDSHVKHLTIMNYLENLKFKDHLNIKTNQVGQSYKPFLTDKIYFDLVSQEMV